MKPQSHPGVSGFLCLFVCLSILAAGRGSAAVCLCSLLLQGSCWPKGEDTGRTFRLTGGDCLEWGAQAEGLGSWGELGEGMGATVGLHQPAGLAWITWDSLSKVKAILRMAIAFLGSLIWYREIWFDLIAGLLS